MKYTNSYFEDVDEVLGCIPGIEQLYGKSILITGATGMICSAVVDLLMRLNRRDNAGIRVIAAGRSRDRLYSRFEGFSEEDGLIYEPFDATELSRIEIMRDVDYVIHGASNANPAIYMKEPVETILANVTGLNAMLDLAVQKRVMRLLYISSSEVYGENSSLDPFDERAYGFVDILSQRAGYPCSKRTGESLCIAYGMEYGLDTVMVRPGHIYGPTITKSDNRASAEFTVKALAGEDIVMKSRGTQLRSYCHTLDCASAILTVLIGGENGQAYNISNPDSICTIADIAQAFAKAADTEVRFSEATDAEKKSYNPATNSSLRSDKLEALGWRACFPLERGARQTLETLRG